MTEPSPALLARLLAELPGLAGLAPEDLLPMRAKGAAHRHYRIAGKGLVLRAPLLSQWSLPAEENLAYQAACFRRAEPSGATPRLAAVLPPRPELPRGALLVEEIAGRVPRLPGDLEAIAAALARLHALPLPPPAERPPLRDHSAPPGPFAATAALVASQSPALDRLELAPATRAALGEELAWAAALGRESAAWPQPVRLVGTDTHPGNFVIREDGTAILVDLEKALYGAPAIDLAHATLASSTTWDLDIDVELTREETLGFYRAWLARVEPALAAASRPLLAPARRLTFLRTVLWCARWRLAVAAGGEWAAARLDPALFAHIDKRTRGVLASDFIARARREWTEEPPFSP